ncbi:hypothetical protein COX00_02770 [Candidatus Uhrbacteria bacterium CG22_combo_CG10-13_8_21_14_all_47_17]|uniref:Uncharacterized protein n=1 Tax=Candidatus Uhrbacteria bacterium CG22_combo_CG10-13_8_21_14_all_47_17 TaxID=1975041 RepID=A0A2H0BSB1_9BACT|nr:MAG: hypothetical protein COX00_02770 [Candidatus Uhrbacteria bacterium CG22_combo_CG10-13_8_21_14_all_47_17]
MKSLSSLRVIAIALPWLAALCVAGWLFTIHYPASGIIHFSGTFDGSSPWLHAFEPGERVNSPGPQSDGWVGQRIFDQPVYNSARVPGAFDDVQIALELRSLRQPLVELGMLRDPETFSFEMQPLWSEALSSGWREVTTEGLHGYVLENQPDSALFSSDLNQIMTWDATTTPPAWNDEPRALHGYDVSLRGQHDFHIIPVNGSIHFEFLLQDMNRSREGKNIAAFRLTKGDELIWTGAGTVSGITDNRPSIVFSRTIDVQNLDPGVYHLSFVADDDLFIREIKTTARHWVIGPRLYFGDEVGFHTTSTPSLAWSNSLHIVADTFHTEGLQTISFGSNTAQLRETHTPYALARDPEEQSGAVRFSAPKGNVRLIADGYFALEESALFLPSPRRLTAESHPKEEGIIAVITPYKQPQELFDGWYRANANYQIIGDPDTLKFSLAAPGIASRSGAIDIRSFSLTYERPALSWKEWLQSVRREISSAWRRL